MPVSRSAKSIEIGVFVARRVRLYLVNCQPQLEMSSRSVLKRPRTVRFARAMVPSPPTEWAMVRDPMKILLFGASGTAGGAVLQACLNTPVVEEVRVKEAGVFENWRDEDNRKRPHYALGYPSTMWTWCTAPSLTSGTFAEPGSNLPSNSVR